MSLIYLKCISPPLLNALNLDEVKLYLKIDHECEDDFLNLLIKSAVRKCENYISKALIHQEWYVVYEKMHSCHLTLPVTPVLKVLEIMGADFYGNKRVYNKSFYKLERSKIDFFVIPMCYRLFIKFLCGYGKSSKEIPEELKSLLLEHVAYMYENRSCNISYNMEKYREYKSIKV